MFEIKEKLLINPFSLSRADKRRYLESELSSLTEHHRSNCPEYESICRTLNVKKSSTFRLEDIPFIPVRLFKIFDLKSISQSDVFKVLTSSGTSGQQTSRIIIDKSVAEKQSAVLTKITCDFIGSKRIPMLVIDTKETIQNPRSFSARAAGILGFSIFGTNRTFALDRDMKIDFPTVQAFLEKHKGSKILLFGFTSIIWEHFFKALRNSDVKIDLSDSILIHGGGWKKLQDQAVDDDIFKSSLREVIGIPEIVNYYGMIEQTGSIFFQCSQSNFHTSLFSDIIIRDDNFQVAPLKSSGLIQLLSVLPTSYPGHSILTEDVGQILGEDDCKCGRLGKYFKISGRIAKAEVRGCSDTTK